MAENKKAIIKKIIRDYAATIVATVLLLMILTLLLLFRHNALLSVNDLSKINPLITSAEGDYVAVNDSGELIEAPQDDGESSQDKRAIDNKKDADSSGKQTANPQGSKGGSSNSGAIVIDDLNNTGDTPKAPSQPDNESKQPQFTVIIDGPISASMNSKCNALLDLFGSCALGNRTYTYTVTAQVIAKNGPGVITYAWKLKPNTGDETVHTSSVTVGSGTVSRSLSHEWKISQCKTYDIELTITQPNNQEKATLRYTPNCS